MCLAGYALVKIMQHVVLTAFQQQLFSGIVVGALKINATQLIKKHKEKIKLKENYRQKQPNFITK